MEKKTALGAAGGISLTVAGAVSALALTLGGGTAAGEPASEGPQGQIVEYVDQNGNPVSMDGATGSVPEIVVTTDQAPATGATDVEMMAAPDPDAAYGEGEEPDAYDEGAEYEEDEHDEHEDGEEYEEEDDD